MQSVDCPNCGWGLGEYEDDGQVAVYCDACGAVFDVDAVEDVAEMYARQEEEERERWIPERSDDPRVAN